MSAAAVVAPPKPPESKPRRRLVIPARPFTRARKAAIRGPEGILPRVQWAAVLIANVHRRDELEETGAWSCACRCCAFAREKAGRP